MDALIFFMLSNVIFYGDFAGDPIHAGWEGRQNLRQFECERLSQPEAHERFPAAIPPQNPRSQALIEIDALYCRHKVLETGTRTPRDEAILDNLDQEIAEMVSVAAKQGDTDTRWVVDAYYPDPAIVRKVASASRVALVQRGYNVSDSAPYLAAGDVEVFRSLHIKDALPLACKRLFQTQALEGGPLGDNVGFLNLALLHPKESQLHVGVCRQGEFRWLR